MGTALCGWIGVFRAAGSFPPDPFLCSLCTTGALPGSAASQLENSLFGNVSPFHTPDPVEDYLGGGGWLEEQSRCLEGTVLFEMLFKALGDSQQQLEGISGW